MAALLGYGVWLVNGWTDKMEDFRAVAATVRRVAADGDIRVFTQAKLLPMDFYYGRELPRIASISELRAYLAASARPTLLIDEQGLKVTPRDLIRDQCVLAALRIHDQSLFILGSRPSEGATGTGCVRWSPTQPAVR